MHPDQESTELALADGTGVKDSGQQKQDRLHSHTARGGRGRVVHHRPRKEALSELGPER